MDGKTTYGTHRDVAVVTLANPPVNSLGFHTRQALAADLDQAMQDGAISAIVLMGNDRIFSAGADITEFGTASELAGPSLLDLIRMLEESPKPVIAAIGATCLGGGLELALGCHYRVAAPAALLGLPEVKIGLLPGAGGSVRLPRAIGLEEALKMILGGEPLTARHLSNIEGQRLIDALIDDDLLDGAIRFAREVSGRGLLPRLRDKAVRGVDADAVLRRAEEAALASGPRARLLRANVEAVAGSLASDFAEGFARSRVLFAELMSTSESKALRHAFFAERAARKIPGFAPSTSVRSIRSAAVIGAGTMGTGIAISLLKAGLPVRVVEVEQGLLDKGLNRIRQYFDKQVSRGKVTAAEWSRVSDGLSGALSYAALSEADLVIEAVFESLDVKQRVFREIDAVAKRGAILATNTSTLDVDEIAGFTGRPADVVGMHFFSPAHVMKLLEVVRGAATAGDVLATVMQLAPRIGKIAVVSGVCDGFIGNRMIDQYLRQAGLMVDEGATPARIDRAAETFGFSMGPFRMSDLAGNDIGWAVRKRRNAERPGVKYSLTADTLCEMGRFGQKVGAGWYDYAAGGRDPLPSPEVERMIADHRSRIGVTPRIIGEREIVDRLIFSLVNEGARILQEGIAAKASDIDLVYLSGYGFPRERGGPLCYADSVGLFNVERAMRAFARNPHDDAEFWKPAEMIESLVRQGKTFT